MKRFSEAIQSKILLFDGSMGALLSRMGHVTPCPDELAVTRPDVIRSVHQGYLDAGADVLLSDTFGATEMTLAHKKRAGMGEKITAAAVRLAREVAGSRALVARRYGADQRVSYPTGEAMPADFYKTFFDQARCAKENGADFAMIENRRPTSAKRALPVWPRAPRVSKPPSASPSAEKPDARSPAPRGMLRRGAGSRGRGGAGAELLAQPGGYAQPFARHAARVRPAVVVQPNAGMPETAPDGSTFYPYSPEKMRECARALLEAGASAIGGCCGTTFDHIRALKPLTGGPVPRRRGTDRRVCAPAATVRRSRKRWKPSPTSPTPRMPTTSRATRLPCALTCAALRPMKPPCARWTRAPLRALPLTFPRRRRRCPARPRSSPAPAAPPPTRPPPSVPS